ncbi:5-methyltetrahydropteroyltriglutamate--homocysteine methyltransferase [Devosia limi DSM 17137]|uniref:5-methyltetrahydropteroyltriglutamate--homocysteine methyltransferase n=1 Tax=Devosia limi DSM 17137 TaxID=1121477 RepID=A0A0F5L2E0_9HYPH|nr:5-methyltetrahydropteroyltriglutamate--homocysteine S-methyltransferase [Devosia limi]KKB76379.1 5-methyltetrahydropteroyltriglutamate--homocysteine methyltransferase [Devosia limi DSM 17137]SHF71311.1 methionine synthase (B12-independent) [Devosia limi DSM 17137]
MTRSSNLGFPRIGAHRELKKALERYWQGESDAARLLAIAAELRARHWQLQRDKGIEVIPSNDFSLYDQVLDLTAVLGAVPPRFAGEKAGLDTYFAMARGTAAAPAMEMTKWFDTNYHFIVPEFHAGQRFALSARKPIDEFLEARALGIHTRPVLIGPVTYLSLGKAKDAELAPLDLLDQLLPAYGQLLAELKAAGADWVQIDEPVLALDLSDAQRAAFAKAYAALAPLAPSIMLTSYFEGLGDNAELATSLPVAGLHIDLVRAPEQLPVVLKALPADKVLSIGIVDGRNIWRTDLARQSAVVDAAWSVLGPERLEIAPSCSLLHSPVDLAGETGIDTELKSWLAFATQKLEEVVALTTAIQQGRAAVAEAFAASAAAVLSRRTSPRTSNPAVRARLAAVTPADLSRVSPFSTRRERQKQKFALPAFPTTTIGSFPQTSAVREARAAFRRGEIGAIAYEDFLKTETEKTVRVQEAIGLDVLVHGEFERTDMVEYFGEQLEGYAFTRNGWVQSYGSRCVKPPVVYGDVTRLAPMTVKWSAFAQSLTARPMKGMLTGPVTILQWSFVRDDQPRSQTCRQIALAIRDEVQDLERAGIGIIQIDEPALREGLPLRRSDWAAYLDWSVDAFRLAASGVSDDTQIHTHMCYAEFSDIMDAIAALDADVISIETSRSDMELLEAFTSFAYPNEIGPGVWDIHSPRVPSQADMEAMLRKAALAIAPEQLWVNPDCGLKTRGWPEVEAALGNLVAAARTLRAGTAA